MFDFMKGLGFFAGVQAERSQTRKKISPYFGIFGAGAEFYDFHRFLNDTTTV
jgi:hypothetical protein